MPGILIAGNKGQLGTECASVFGGRADISGIDLPETDITDRAQCMAALDRINADVVVNCAAYTAVDLCETDRDACWKANAEAPGLLAEWVEANRRFLVHVSTDYVFPGDKPLYAPYTETDPTGPVSEYGRSKLAGEQAIAEKTERFAILRTAWLYGLGGGNFLKTMLRLTLQNPGREFQVVNDQYGSPTWARTLARQIEAVIDSGATGLFHASSEGYCNWYDLAHAFLKELHVQHHLKPCTSAEYPTPAKRPVNSILENQRLKSAGINVFKDWKTELKNFTMAGKENLLREAQNEL